MTLDGETAEQVARSILWAGEVGSERIVRAVQAGYAHRDAEVEELRADLDAVAYRAGQYQARIGADTADERDAALATLAKVADLLGSLDLDSDHLTAPGTAWGSILRESLALARGADESPTERETPADESDPEYEALWERIKAAQVVVPDDRA